MSFSIDKIVNLMHQKALETLSTFSQTRIGTISTYNPNNYTAQVLIQPDGILTSYLPILTDWVGNGWGAYFAPTVGDLVMCHFMEGDFTSGFIAKSINNLIDQPPANIPSGECWLVHKTGTFLKFHNDGTIEIKTLDANNNPTNININGNIVLTGNLTASGDILDNSSGSHINTNTIRAMRTIYDGHTHGGVSAGGSNTLDPNQPM